jgi:hypothetical protein
VRAIQARELEQMDLSSEGVDAGGSDPTGGHHAP